MDNTINRGNLIEQMLKVFPQLERPYRQYVVDWTGLDAPSNYEVVAFVLRPYLQKELSGGDASSFLEAFALFCEEVCTSGDIEAINVIWVKVFEWLIFRPNDLKKLWQFLGPSTKSNIRDAAKRWSDAARSNGKFSGLPEENLPV
jgi:hypothetical protein